MNCTWNRRGIRFAIWAVLAATLPQLNLAAGAQKEIAVTWWGCMSVEVNLGGINLVFDPYVKPDLPRFHYIFLSHDHYDHCNEPTLRSLITPDAPLEMLFASRGCFYASRLDGPNYGEGTQSDLAFVPREKAVAMFPKYEDTVNPHIRQGETFGGPVEIGTGRIRVETFRSHEHPAPRKSLDGATNTLGGSFPNLGYLVTDLDTGLAFAHTGDFWNAYPELERLRGKVDVLFYPLGKLGIREKTKMMSYVRPRIAIPVHYRLPEPDFPIPATYLTVMKEEDVTASQTNFLKASLGHWYPSPTNPPLEIASQREAFKGLTRVVELKAGVRYVLPTNLEEFTGRGTE